MVVTWRWYCYIVVLIYYILGSSWFDEYAHIQLNDSLTSSSNGVINQKRKTSEAQVADNAGLPATTKKSKGIIIISRYGQHSSVATDANNVYNYFFFY